MKKVAALLAVFALATAAQAANITWTGAVDNKWDYTTANWTGDASTFSDWDNIWINGPATIDMQPMGSINVGDVTIDTTGGTVDIKWGWGPWGSSAYKGSGTITVNGPGLVNNWDESGYWSVPVSTTYELNGGVYKTGHHHEMGWTGTFGGGATVNINAGATYWYNTWNERMIEWNATGDFNVTGDANIRVSGSHPDGWAEAGFSVSIAAGATLTFIADNGRLDWDNDLDISIAGNVGGSMVVASDLELEDESALNLSVTGSPTAPIVLVDYSSGTLTGTFATVTGVPSGWSIDYAYNGGTQIALVPEPATMALLALGGLAVLRRRRR